MSAISGILSTILNLSFIEGKIDHSSIKTQDEEKSVIWAMTCFYLDSKGYIPSSKSNSHECSYGLQSMRFCVFQIINYFFKISSDKLMREGYGCGSGFKHPYSQITTVVNEISKYDN